MGTRANGLGAGLWTGTGVARKPGLAQRWVAAGWGLLVVVCAAPIGVTLATGLGFSSDDYVHLDTLANGTPFPGGPGPTALFRFMSGEPGQTAVAISQGRMPWFTNPSVKLAFLRPLAGLLHALDFQLFGTNPLGAKLHSALWYVLLCFAVRRLLRHCLAPEPAALAFALFAVAAFHFELVAWVAARNATMSASFGTAALLSHGAYRQRGWTAGAWLAPLLLGFSLSAGESGLGALAYLGAFELLYLQGPLAPRIRALLPAAAVTAAWLTIYLLGGHGAAGSSAYLDPFGEPQHFLGEAPGRGFGLLASLYLGWPADAWLFAPQWRGLAAVLGVVAAGLVLGLVTYGWDQMGRSERRAVFALGVGSSLALIPQTAGLIGERSLTFASLGSFGVLGSLLWHGYRKTVAGSGAAGARGVRTALLLLGVVHLVLSPLWWVVGSGLYLQVYTNQQRALEGLALGAGEAAIVVSAPDAFASTMYLVPRQRALGRPVPDVFHTLSMSPHPHRLHRTGRDHVELEAVGGTLVDSPFDWVARDFDRMPLRSGDRVRVQSGLEAEVLAAEAGAPLRVRFEFSGGLDPERISWLSWRDGRYEEFSLPPVGRHILLASASGGS